MGYANARQSGRGAGPASREALAGPGQCALSLSKGTITRFDELSAHCNRLSFSCPWRTSLRGYWRSGRVRPLTESPPLLVSPLRDRSLQLPLEDQVNNQDRDDGNDNGRKQCTEVHRIASL